MKKVYKIAIVEDEAESQKKLEEELRRYEDDKKDVQFYVVTFKDAATFLNKCKGATTSFLWILNCPA